MSSGPCAEGEGPAPHRTPRLVPDRPIPIRMTPFRVAGRRSRRSIAPAPHRCIPAFVPIMFHVSRFPGPTSMRVRRPPASFPPAGRRGGAVAPFRGRPAAHARPHPPAAMPVAMPVAAPRRPAPPRNAPIRICPERAITHSPAAAVQRSTSPHARPSHPRRICPKRAVAAVPAARRWPAPSAPLRAAPGRARGIRPKSAVAAVPPAPRPAAPFRLPPDRPRGICPKRAPAVRNPVATRRAPPAPPAP